MVKLRIKESADDSTINIDKRTRDRLNKIAAKYSTYLTPKQFSEFYNEIKGLGVVIPQWSSWDDETGHPYYWMGKKVDNSMFMLQKYEGSGSRDEYNLYFS